MALSGGPWNLQEAITEQQTVSRRADRPLTLSIEKIFAPPTVSTRSQTQNMRNGENPFILRVMDGTVCVKQIRVSMLLSTKHEIRLVPPTRATLLYSDSDVSNRQSSGFGRSPSQDGNYQSNKSCFIKLCFQSLGDLKTASQDFLRLGLRCTTQFKPLHRTPSAPMRAIPSAPFHRSSYPMTTISSHGNGGTASTQFTVEARSQSHQPSQTYRIGTMPEYASAAFSEKPVQEQYQNVTSGLLKRRISSISESKSKHQCLRRESSSLDSNSSLWTSMIPQSGSMFWSQPPVIPRMGSKSQEHLTESEDLDNGVSEPPPRRDLPQAIKRHISQTPSQVEGGLDIGSRPSCRENSTNRQVVTTVEMGVQTEKSSINPETVVLESFELFQKLQDLETQMVKECFGASKGLGLDSDEDKASLAAHYAWEFGQRFSEICEKNDIFCTGVSFSN